jgi:molybdate transport system substrate-binding protein
MVKIAKLSLFFYLFCWSFFSILPNALAGSSSKDSSSLTIFSESNMTYPLTQISRLYSAQSNTIVSINFNSSSELIRNIDYGEPADIFISSHPSWIETLKQKGLIDVYNLTNIAKDSLVLVSSISNKEITPQEIAKTNDITKILKIINKKRIPLIVDSEFTSLGKYTASILKTANIKNHKIYRKVSEDKKAIIDFIDENDEYCGIVMASSVKNYKNIVVLKEIPNSEVYYQVLVIAGDNMSQGRNFLEFVKSNEVKEILSNSGFVLGDKK